jgi:hypothetical protein
MLVETFFRVSGGKNLTLKCILFLLEERKSQIKEQIVKSKAKQKIIKNLRRILVSTFVKAASYSAGYLHNLKSAKK